ncbi:MAG: hypothetical protein LBS09_07215 [Bacteroidales bacterium]|jgi:hypothetical protein|nr:hypothetical protein [Bacteroidales bacterium]
MEKEEKIKYATSVFHYAAKEERRFEASLLLEIAICILAGDRFNPDLVLPTYFWYNNEYSSDGCRFAPIKQVISKKDIAVISQFIIDSHAISFAEWSDFRNYIKRFFSLREGDMFSIDRLDQNRRRFQLNAKFGL